jgi:hypothetical protein
MVVDTVQARFVALTQKSIPENGAFLHEETEQWDVTFWSGGRNIPHPENPKNSRMCIKSCTRNGGMCEGPSGEVCDVMRETGR